MMTEFQKAASQVASWRRDPVLFVRANFDVEPDLWQIRALRAENLRYSSGSPLARTGQRSDGDVGFDPDARTLSFVPDIPKEDAA